MKKPVTADEFQAQLMTDEKYLVISKQLRQQLEKIDGIYSPPELKLSRRAAKALFHHINASTVPALGEPNPGSALHPVAGGKWHIGSLGSVWLDTQVGEYIYRIGFDPANNRFELLDVIYVGKGQENSAQGE
jgi:hypothetical protein